MNYKILKKWPAGACHFVILALLTVSSGFADTISTTLPSDGNAVDLSELEALGLLPGTFLFTGNSMYDYVGDEVITVVSAEIDPGQTTSLNGVTTVVETITLTIVSDGSDSSTTELVSDTEEAVVPETPTLALSIMAAGFLAAPVMRRLRGRVRAGAG